MSRPASASTDGRIHWRQTFTALRYRNYRLWFYGQLTSLFGSWMQTTAQGFLIFSLTRSPAFLGYVGFAAGAPAWLFMLYAGIVADRMSRRRLMILTQTAMLVLAFVSAALIFLGVVRPWHIILLAFGFGTANAFDAPARQALVHELVPPEDLTNAIALNAAMFNTSAALGPAVGGITYALFGPAWCFVINGLSFIAVIVALSVMKLAPHEPPAQRASALAELKEGLRYVRRHELIKVIVASVLVLSLFGFAFVTLLPAWAVKILHGGPAVNGFLTAARGLGALISALLIASLGRFKFRGRLLTLGGILYPALLIGFAFLRVRPLAYLFLFIAGLAQTAFFNLANAAVQTMTAPRLRGRVMGIYSLAFFGSMPLGAMLIGTLAARLGEPAAIILTSSICLAFITLMTATQPKLRRLE